MAVSVPVLHWINSYLWHAMWFLWSQYCPNIIESKFFREQAPVLYLKKQKQCLLHLCSSLFVQFQFLHVPWSLWICAQAEVSKDKHVGIPTFVMKERYLPSYLNYANVITDLISVLFVWKYTVWERNCHEAIFSRTLLLWDMI